MKGARGGSAFGEVPESEGSFGPLVVAGQPMYLRAAHVDLPAENPDPTVLPTITLLGRGWDPGGDPGELPLPHGQLLAGQYRLIRPLGYGGMGEVYLALDTKVDNREVAIKMLHPEQAAAAAGALARERRALVDLGHDDIIRVFNYGHHPEAGDFLVLQYVDGLTLEEVRARAELNPGEFGGHRFHEFVLAYGVRILSALAYLHADRPGKVYGDLKPDNVMHDGTTTKIIDVGSVRPVGAPGMTTKGFSAPTVGPNGESREQDDLFSLGETLRRLSGLGRSAADLARLGDLGTLGGAAGEDPASGAGAGAARDARAAAGGDVARAGGEALAGGDAARDARAAAGGDAARAGGEALAGGDVARAGGDVLVGGDEARAARKAFVVRDEVRAAGEALAAGETPGVPEALVTGETSGIARAVGAEGALDVGGTAGRGQTSGAEVPSGVEGVSGAGGALGVAGGVGGRGSVGAEVASGVEGASGGGEALGVAGGVGGRGSAGAEVASGVEGVSGGGEALDAARVSGAEGASEGGEASGAARASGAEGALDGGGTVDVAQTPGSVQTSGVGETSGGEETLGVAQRSGPGDQSGADETSDAKQKSGGVVQGPGGERAPGDGKTAGADRTSAVGRALGAEGAPGGGESAGVARASGVVQGAGAEGTLSGGETAGAARTAGVEGAPDGGGAPGAGNGCVPGAAHADEEEPRPEVLSVGGEEPSAPVPPPARERWAPHEATAPVPPPAKEPWAPHEATAPVPRGLGLLSLARVLHRATSSEPAGRFADAREMDQQLRGVFRELRSLRTGTETFEPSPLFLQSPYALDGALGSAPPLAHWAAPDAPSPFAPPTPAEVAQRLPVPRPDPHDEHHAELSRLADAAPEALLQHIGDWRDSTEVHLLRCRLRLRNPADGPEAAERELRAAEARIGPRRAPYDWRLDWHHGLLALAGEQVAAARRHFDRVYAAIPGEYAPKLALGQCAERLGRRQEALTFYEAVGLRNPSLGSAAFGAARARLALGGETAREDAVRELDAVPQHSRHRTAARTAAVRIGIEYVRTGECDDQAPQRLGEVLGRLALLFHAHGLTDEEARVRMTVEAWEAVQGALARGALDAAGLAALSAGADPRLGLPSDEHGLREDLSRRYVTLAHQAARSAAPEDAAVAEILLDRAYEVRPLAFRHHRDSPWLGKRVAHWLRTVAYAPSHRTPSASRGQSPP
ncbi:tetratricopeptide repeat protein [Streptomyces sp. SAI-127]|uniref:tetratricopeptide repeat protein n=1 Tax=Streptomyces sp. SAI-127 TaxID=2940543 RepID=UPI0024738973|nr:tetratricopeptide repeat protein [Streptomyces sp. SAI-127]MDH6492428.1 tetratricopeptide (TPR) repeat protein [Streptomyces sp. SAI-127]